MSYVCVPVVLQSQSNWWKLNWRTIYIITFNTHKGQQLQYALTIMIGITAVATPVKFNDLNAYSA